MKHLEFDNGKSFGLSFRSLTMQQLLRRMVAICLLVLFSAGTWATDYVFVYSNHYLTSSIGYGDTFIPNTCIWTCDNNSLDNSTSRALHSYGSSTTYLRGTTTNGNSPTTGESQENWRMNDSRLYYRSGNTSYYLYYRGSQWRLSSTQGYNNDNTSWQGGWSSYTDYRATVYPVDIDYLAGGYSDFSISGDEYITATGTKNYSHTNSYNQTACSTYTFNGTTYYSTDAANAASTTNPQTEITSGYTWSLSGNGSYASVNASTGAITVSSIPDEDVVMTLTCTVNGKSATKQVILTKNPPVAAGYVIYDGNNHYLGGTSTTAITSFNPNTCLWTGTNGGKWQNARNYYLRMDRYNYELTTSQSNATNLNLLGTETGTTGQKIYDAYNDTRYYFLKYSSGAWNKGDRQYSATTDETNTNVVFAVTKRDYVGADNTTHPTISATVNDAKTGIQFSHTNVSGTFSPAYTDYVFYDNTHHYWYGNANHTSAPATVNFSATNATYIWSITSGGDYASIDATSGLLTSKGAATSQQTVTVTLTTTEASSGYSNTQTYTVRIQDHAATTVTAGIGDYNVINAVNGTLNLRGILNGSYTAAYTTYTFNSVSHNLYNGIDYGYNTPTINEANTCTYTWSLSGEGASHSALSSSTGQTPTLIYTSDAGHDVIVNANLTVTHPDFPEFSATAEPFPVTLYSATITAPTIDFTAGTNTVTLSVPLEGTTYYTTDGSDPKTSSAKQTFDPASPIAVATSPMVVKAYSERWGVASTVSERTITLKLGTPEISFADDGTVTITLANAPTGTEFYYTTDGNAPTSTSTLYNSSSKPKVNNGTTVKVIAVKTGYDSSDIASDKFEIESGIIDGVVILNDYEDHNWTYYQKSDNLPAGYPTGYLNSPDPRNVKITYRGGGVEGASAVAISGLEGEGQNTMVYYKTLEKHDLSVKDDGEYAYTVISNPFSKRPRTTGSTGTDGYYGFAGWKIISGAEYIQRATGKATPTNNTTVLDLDETIHFVNLDNDYTPNCTSAEVVFEATWTPAQVKTGTSVPSFDSGYTTYETRFWVISGNITGNGALSIGTACTMMAKNPDGTTGGYNSYTIQRAITAGTDNVKIEWVKFNSTGAVDANGKTFTIGRGVVQNGTGGPLYGINTDANCVNTVKIESGKYSLLHNFNSGNSNGRSVDQLMILGCDYDRAKGENGNLSITGEMYVGKSINLHRTSGELFCRAVIKSGNFQPGVNAQGSEYTGVGGSHTYYMSVNGTAYPGRRYMLVEGGHHRGLNGGMDEASGQSTTDRAFDLRVRGTAQIDGVVYGGAEYANAKGTRTMIFTGGTINGWVAGGANGTQSTNGKLSGSTYLYIGGKTSVDSRHSTKVMNRSVGGNVYGAGCGYSGTSSSGEVTLGTNIVVADNAFVERGVYGGGGFGFSSTGQTSNIYITGGHIGGYTGTDSGNTTIHGGVYGGARQNDGGSSNIIMTGGLVEGGLYGGSNSSGTLSGNVTMQINGGQVGTTTASANIHGGGYGQNTSVSGDVNVTLGSRDTSTDVTSGTAVVYGDVYGGSALGSVNGTSANTDYHTNVTLNAGTIHGSIYGGALGATGTAANVYGPVAVKVYGGSVMTTDGTGENGSGAVYGCNNINGAPQRAVTVDIYGTDEAQEEGEYALFAVYGGGNHANYTYGNGYPKVTIHNCDNSIEYVYGGGNQATVPGTQVKVYGGNVIGNVFGGGNNANVTTNGTDVDIYGGTILNVFGGNNNGGAVTGNISVTIDAQAETIGDDPCDISLGNVYGGGNIASYTGNPVVDFLNGTSTGSVFGGGKGKEAVVVGNPTVNIGDWDDNHSAYIGGNVFGGGDLAAVEGNPAVTIRDCGTAICGDLYGGGNAAPVYSTNTTMWGGTVKGNVFGGGNGSDATKNPNGAQVGYKRDDATAGTGDGNAVTNIYGGTIGTWTTDGKCTAGGGIFGGSNTNGNIRGAVQLTMDEQACTETDAEQCDLKVKEAYGAGNLAAYAGAGIQFGLGCITSMSEIYGGAKAADLKGDVNLKITNGHFGKVFGGNNISGKLDGKIVVTVDETGCTPVTIGALYGGGNQAAYSVYGYDTDGTPKESGDAKADPVVNIVSCTRIDTIFGGGLGSTAVMVGNPKVTVQQVAGKYDPDDDDASDGYSANTGKLGIIGTIFGGGNEAEVKGNPEIRIATEDAILRADGTTSLSRQSANISGNVYGGGNKAKVTGNTKVTVGPKKTAEP